MAKTKKLKELEKNEENAFESLINTLELSQLHLFREYHAARHLRELEQFFNSRN